MVFGFNFVVKRHILSPMAKYVFGPVPSRRLGFSLGVDIIPPKYCSFDCIYCQIGRTPNSEVSRKAFMDPHEVIDEVIEVVKRTKEIDFITFSGSGEPTLNSDIGFMIEEVRKATNIPVAVITNGALLYQAEVRRDLAHADVVLPSLDAVSEDIFRYINRPHSLLEIETIIRGLKLFRTEYTGNIWLEIMLIKNINDGKDEIRKFVKVLSEIKADKIHLNTVTRPPCDEARGHVTMAELEKIRDLLGPTCEIIGSFEKSVSEVREDDWSTSVVEILKRRSLTLEDIVQITGVTSPVARDRLKILEEEGLIVSYTFHDSLFYKMP